MGGQFNRCGKAEAEKKNNASFSRWKLQKSSVCAHWEGWWQCDLGNGKESTKEMQRADRRGAHRQKRLKHEKVNKEQTCALSTIPGGHVHINTRLKSTDV